MLLMLKLICPPQLLAGAIWPHHTSEDVEATTFWSVLDQYHRMFDLNNSIFWCLVIISAYNRHQPRHCDSSSDSPSWWIPKYVTKGLSKTALLDWGLMAELAKRCSSTNFMQWNIAKVATKLVRLNSHHAAESTHINQNKVLNFKFPKTGLNKFQ